LTRLFEVAHRFPPRATMALYIILYIIY
jgi:hypothetical protein